MGLKEAMRDAGCGHGMKKFERLNQAVYNRDDSKNQSLCVSRREGKRHMP